MITYSEFIQLCILLVALAGCCQRIMFWSSAELLLKNKDMYMKETRDLDGHGLFLFLVSWKSDLN